MPGMLEEICACPDWATKAPVHKTPQSLLLNSSQRYCMVTAHQYKHAPMLLQRMEQTPTYIGGCSPRSSTWMQRATCQRKLSVGQATITPSSGGGRKATAGGVNTGATTAPKWSHHNTPNSVYKLQCNDTRANREPCTEGQTICEDDGTMIHGNTIGTLAAPRDLPQRKKKERVAWPGLGHTVPYRTDSGGLQIAGRRCGNNHGLRRRGAPRRRATTHHACTQHTLVSACS